MKKISFLFLCFFILMFRFSPAQDTFSICAIDPVTGQVGSAGASCIAGSIILSDVHPNIGVIHTQAYWNASNQNYAKQLMNIGLSPQQIIDSLIAHDAQNNPTIRQYGIVDRVGGGRSAAYTGVNCNNYKNHILGPTYSIQGNILLGQQILDSMQSRFLNTTGTLADKLMAALQGAKVVGADTRCMTYGTSSLSAFLRIAKTTDPPSGPYYCDLNVNNSYLINDPIDSLQVLYNQWLLTGISNHGKTIIPDRFALYQNYPNPFNPSTTISFDIAERTNVRLVIYDIMGSEVGVPVDNITFNPGVYSVVFDASGLSSGVYFYKLMTENFAETKKMTLVK